MKWNQTRVARHQWPMKNKPLCFSKADRHYPIGIKEHNISLLNITPHQIYLFTECCARQVKSETSDPFNLNHASAVASHTLKISFPIYLDKFFPQSLSANRNSSFCNEMNWTAQNRAIIHIILLCWMVNSSRKCAHPGSAKCTRNLQQVSELIVNRCIALWCDATMTSGFQVESLDVVAGSLMVGSGNTISESVLREEFCFVYVTFKL